MDRNWYFTAPWDSIPIRRGDALGLRAGADYFAELLAPGLNNSTSDARWISLLSWCLCWSHVAWDKAGGGDLSSRDGQRSRYDWLRPLELLWVARTLESGQDSGQLRGRRSIERWLKGDPRTFGMSDDQFRRYRQIGMYGGYRVAFRTIPGLTTGDGWTPTETALELAKVLDDSLGKARPNFGGQKQWGHWNKGRQAEFWTKHGWTNWAQSVKKGLRPTPSEDVRGPLPDKERELLEPVLFGAGSVRRVTAEVLANAKGAKSHTELCDALARSDKFDAETQKKLAPLPAFTRLADTAMDAMRTLWSELNHNGEDQAPTIKKLACSTDLQSKLEQLRHASETWLKAPGRSTFPHEQVPTQLAKAMRGAASPIEQLRALASHHHQYGGGRRWFREQAEKIVPLVADTGIAASDYRFRLRPICLLAAQCGVPNMNRALDALGGLTEEEMDEEKDNE